MSRGMEDAEEGETMKQSSMSGSVAPSVKGLLGVRSGKGATEEDVGMPPASTGRYDVVERVTCVPSIVGEPERLKYLFRSHQQGLFSPLCNSSLLDCNWWWRDTYE